MLWTNNVPFLTLLYNGNNKKNYKIYYCYNHNGEINNFWRTNVVYNIPNIMQCVNKHSQRYDK